MIPIEGTVRPRYADVEQLEALRIQNVAGCLEAAFARVQLPNTPMKAAWSDTVAVFTKTLSK